ncbi:MAG: flippase-like domain-containing protein, partial [Bradyrhizobiaceae bacterium]|nr:flippase-like domain-containing protein [Bradyrhizobiaceae bacterium]
MAQLRVRRDSAAVVSPQSLIVPVWPPCLISRMRMGALKHIGIFLWCAGIAACIALAVRSGLSDVGKALASVGWGMLGVVLTRTVTVATAGAGWRLLFPADGPLQLGTAVLLRFVREGINTLLPLTQVGGDIIAARLLTFWAVPGPLGGASLIVDVLMQAATQFLFTAIGIMALIALGTDSTVAGTAAVSLAVAAPLLGAFYVVQRRFGHRILVAVLSRFDGDGNWRVLGTIDAVYRNLSAIYARRGGVAASGVVHLAGWLGG